MQDAADHAPVVDTLLAAHVRGQIRLDPPPLFVTQPKQIASHPLALSNHTERESATDSRSNAFIECAP